MNERHEKRSRSADALHALSQGEETAASGPEEQQETGAEVPSGMTALAGDQAFDPGHAEAVMAAVPAHQDPLAVRKARAASLVGQSRRVYAHQFKKTMIPLLLTVGGLLFLFSLITLAMIAPRIGDDTMSSTRLVRYGGYLILAALPLGAILVLGAWMFHKEVSAAERLDRQTRQNRQRNGYMG